MLANLCALRDFDDERIPKLLRALGEMRPCTRAVLGESKAFQHFGHYWVALKAELLKVCFACAGPDATWNKCVPIPKWKINTQAPM
jgi:hypothetical protein